MFGAVREVLVVDRVPDLVVRAVAVRDGVVRVADVPRVGLERRVVTTVRALSIFALTDEGFRLGGAFDGALTDATSALTGCGSTSGVFGVTNSGSGVSTGSIIGSSTSGLVTAISAGPGIAGRGFGEIVSTSSFGGAVAVVSGPATGVDKDGTSVAGALGAVTDFVTRSG